MSILDGLKLEKETPKGNPKVYHLVWDRDSELSKKLASTMTKAYGQKFDVTNLQAKDVKTFLLAVLTKIDSGK